MKARDHPINDNIEYLIITSGDRDMFDMDFTDKPVCNTCNNEMELDDDDMWICECID